jgi:CHAT domain-containing protein/predicted HD phosphohydrolase
MTAGQIRFHSLLGGIALQQFEFREALPHYQQARLLAERSGDWEEWVAASLNLVSLYDSNHDVESAVALLRSIESRMARVPRPYFAAQLWLHQGKHAIYAEARERAFFEAIEAARRIDTETGEPGLQQLQIRRAREAEALAWTYLGVDALKARNHARAAEALRRGYAIRFLNRLPSLPASEYWLAELHLAENDSAGAWRRHQRASTAGFGIAGYLLRHQRARIRAAQGDESGAIADWLEARREAARWRQNLMPADPSLAGLDDDLLGGNQELRSPVTGPVLALVRSGVRRYQKRPSEKLAAEMLAAVEETRGAALGQTERRRFEKARLPAEYWELLAQRRRQLANAAARGSSGNSPEDAATELRLREFERQAGLFLPHLGGESFSLLQSLTYFRDNEGSDEAWFSFVFDQDVSYRWCVADRRVSVSLLPGREALEARLETFRKTILESDPGWRAQAESLFQTLFGSAPPAALNKSRWVVSADGSLWSTPLAALAVREKSGASWLLAERRSIIFAPGLAPPRPARFRGRTLLAAGDPAYNTADERTIGQRPRRVGQNWLLQASSGDLTLPRLVGSGHESDRAAAAWSGPSLVLKGPSVTRERLAGEIEKLRPGVFHLAAHVIAPPEQPALASLALSIDGRGSLDLLTPYDVRHLPLEGALVVLSGCGSGRGSVRRGAGLQGLTRSLLAAGASAVIASHWPVPDDRGALFESFYRHLRKVDPPEALRLAQAEAIRASGWRSKPRFWAAYGLIRGGQWSESARRASP